MCGSNRLLAPGAALSTAGLAAGGAWRDIALVVDLPTSHTVLDLKLRIAQEWHLPVGSQDLTMPSRQGQADLRDEESLGEVGCKEDALHEVQLRHRD